MDSTISLPLFPLNTVLFPGQVLPMHIFEPRYRTMIGKCIETGMPFGVVLIKDGEEVGGVATPYEVGTTARITQVERLEDGRLNIITVGEVRFRILNMREEQGYWMADVSLWPWPPSDHEALDALAQRVQDRLRSYVDMLSEMAGVPLDASREELPDQPAVVAFLAAIALQVTQSEKQDLLTSTSIPALLAKEIMLFRRELRVLRLMVESHGRPKPDEEPVLFSLN